MGRKLDLSRLTDEEARHVWDVVQRDFALRRKEEERLAVARMGALDWYYGHVRARFKRFGSAEVIRSLWARLPDGGVSDGAPRSPSAHSGPEPSAGEGSGDRAPTGTDGEPDAVAQAQPLGSKPAPARKKRLLRIHSPDFEANSDDSSGSWGRPPSRCSSPGALGRLQTLTGEPCMEDATTSNSGHPLRAEVQTDSLAELCPPGASCAAALGVTAAPGPCILGTEQPPTPFPADGGTSSEDSATASRRSTRGGRPSSDSQCQGAREAADPRVEEETLRRKLEELTCNVSDPGASSEEEGSGPLQDLGTTPQVNTSTGCTPEQEQSPWGPQDPVWPARTPEEALSALEDRAALTASELQQAESEVSDIECRIAALREAGLTVGSAEKRQRRSKLPVLLPRLAGTPGQSPKHPPADPVDGAKVMAVPSLLRKKVSDSPDGQGDNETPFDRKSGYRGSLTQRNPNGRRGAAHHSCAKPVMVHPP